MTEEEARTISMSVAAQLDAFHREVIAKGTTPQELARVLGESLKPLLLKMQAKHLERVGELERRIVALESATGGR